ncbi:acyl-CoA desaturase [Pseudonocardia sp. KRD-184]|uniref:Acyl-CoA desaturase n=1 Tax=Pseudonocardia oceani TaxID=2792013 RepID=A0ABS6UIN2_9PSEU|nr:acyl-CoA desaturase [Pseudonocardia oceani]MBW0092574.1 acyl-CoA desaturase [Pseudonocardia oceani]MBW0097025.1 acyl-CoA desaturase [Pseudonocardia oceani]MBW0112553.1 acyl-CoA desaturase [Pseudonocardia oceani]MBW0125066.1 acyl-CoA desaturase [Pseudonocardia oceani]MBW0132084.1 acyl-CoA desaturase [Pseudonocardia oceani]
MTTDEPARAGTRTASDFARLSRRISAAGLLDPAPTYYVGRALVLAAVAAATVTAFLLLDDSWWQLAVAAVAAAVYGQIALLAHDIAHRQVFRSRAVSAWAGRLVGNVGIGMAYGWWMQKHTRHHADPNHIGRDPDVAPGSLAFTADQARASHGPARFLVRHQDALFFPVLTLSGLDLRRAGIAGLLRGRMPHRRTELALVATHITAYLTALFVLLPPGLAVAFFAVHQCLFGVYLGSIFAPNHKGMQMPTERMDFLRKQVLTSRNVRGGRLTDGLLHVAMGGLNHQIEHHLFPSMPTPHQRRARVVVREFCAEVGVSYHETTLLGSWAEMLAALRAAAAPLRRVPA